MSEQCFCDRMYPDSNPDASCGDCPTRDYGRQAPAALSSLLRRCREFIDTTTSPAYPAGADLADEIDAALAALAPQTGSAGELPDVLADALDNLEYDNYERSYSGSKNREADAALIRAALAAQASGQAQDAVLYEQCKSIIDDAARWRYVLENLGFDIAGDEGVGKFDIAVKTRNGEALHLYGEYLVARVDAARTQEGA